MSIRHKITYAVVYFASTTAILRGGKKSVVDLVSDATVNSRPLKSLHQCKDSVIKSNGENWAVDQFNNY